MPKGRYSNGRGALIRYSNPLELAAKVRRKASRLPNFGARALFCGEIEARANQHKTRLMQGMLARMSRLARSRGLTNSSGLFVISLTKIE